MTQEEKELLYQDLCCRIPYGIKAQVYNHWRDDFQDETITIENLYQLIKTFSIEDIKPYLFPLSSMTEEQKKEYNLLKDFVPTYHYEYGDIIEDIELCDNLGSIDYLIANHFDYRDLIPMGLANDATNLNIY